MSRGYERPVTGLLLLPKIKDTCHMMPLALGLSSSHGIVCVGRLPLIFDVAMSSVWWAALEIKCVRQGHEETVNAKQTLSEYKPLRPPSGWPQKLGVEWYSFHSSKICFFGGRKVRAVPWDLSAKCFFFQHSPLCIVFCGMPYCSMA